MLSSASSPSSSQAGSESSVVDTDSQRLPAGFKGRGGGDKSAVEQSKSQQVERQLNEVLQESRASTSAPTQALPAFQEPEPVQLGLPGLSYELPPFAQRAELVVTSPQPSPPPVPPVPTFPLADPYAGKVGCSTLSAFSMPVESSSWHTEPVAELKHTATRTEHLTSHCKSSLIPFHPFIFHPYAACSL